MLPKEILMTIVILNIPIIIFGAVFEKTIISLTWNPANLRKTIAGQAGGGAARRSSAPASSRRPNLAKGPSCTAKCKRALHRLNSRTLVYLNNSENTARLSDSC